MQVHTGPSADDPAPRFRPQPEDYLPPAPQEPDYYDPEPWLCGAAADDDASSLASSFDGASDVDPSSPVRHADDDDPWAGF